MLMLTHRPGFSHSRACVGAISPIVSLRLFFSMRAVKPVDALRLPLSSIAWRKDWPVKIVSVANLAGGRTPALLGFELPPPQSQLYLGIRCWDGSAFLSNLVYFLDRRCRMIARDPPDT